MDHPSSSLLASALRWWDDAGVDVLVRDEPRDWLVREAPTHAAEPAMLTATEAAKAPDRLPDTLAEFCAWAAEQGPWRSATGPVIPPAGNASSALMVLVDMPGREDESSLLSGEAGLLFDRMLAAIGRSRSDLYLSALSWRRLAGGSLRGETLDECSRLARHHLSLAAPRRLLLLGDGCARALLGKPLNEARGRWHRISAGGAELPVLATLPPALLLERPSLKAMSWADLRSLNRELAQ